MKLLLTNEIVRFRKQLLYWHKHHNQRSMPWKGIRNPYYIWLSEIILQQTRVEQGMAYYERFIWRFPTLVDLAQADEAVVFNLWQGLGYYSRCRNLIKTAKIIVSEHAGVFPSQLEVLRTLPGIGDYTAAAIASFAFKAPYAAVDGNVIRIISRFMASSETPANQAGKKFYHKIAQQLVAPKASNQFNQAMMDLGATICTPHQPQCDRCPLQPDCRAYKTETTGVFPIKKKKNPLKHRHFHFGVFSNQTHIALTKRKTGDIWADLYTPWMVEGDASSPVWPANRAFAKESIQPTVAKQILSHQKIFGYFYSFTHPGKPFLTQHALIWVPKNKLSSLAFPRMVLVFLKNSGYL